MADVAKLEIDVRARVGRAVTSLARLNTQLRALGNNQRQLAGSTRVLTVTTNTLTRTTNNNAGAMRRATNATRGFRDEINDGQGDIMRFVGAVGRLSGGIMGLATVFAVFSAISFAPLILGMVGAMGALLAIIGPVGLALGAFFLTAFQKNTRANEALRQFTIRFEEWAISLDDVIGPPMEKFFDVLGDNLHRLTPLIAAVAPLMGRAAEALDKIFKSKGFNDWIQAMADAAERMLPMLGSALLGFLEGLGGLIVAFLPVGMGLLGWLKDSAKGFANWAKNLPESEGFQNFIGWLRDNGPTMINTIGSIIAALFKLLQALAPIGMVALKVFSNVAEAISSMDTATLTTVITTILLLVAAAKGFMVISGIVEIVMTLGAAFGALAGPVGIVVAIVASLIAQWVVLWHTFAPFRAAITGALMPAINLLWQALQDLWNAVKPIGPELLIVVGIMNTGLVVVIAAVIAVIAAVVEGVAVMINVFRRLATVTRENWGKITSVLRTFGGFLLGPLIGTVVAFVSLIIQNWSKIKNGAKTALNAVKNAFSAAFNWLKDQASSFKNTFLNGPWRAFTQGIPRLIRTAWNKVKDVFNSSVTWVMDKIRNLKDRIKSAFGNAKDLLYNAGKDIVKGLVNGIKDQIGDAVNTIKDVASDIGSAFTGALGIHSPSRVFVEYGGFVVDGLTKGMGQGRVMAPLMNQTMNLAQTVTAPFPTSVNAPTPAPMMVGGGGTTTSESYMFDFRGAVVTGGSKQVEDMVVQALNNAKKKGRVRGLS